MTNEMNFGLNHAPGAGSIAQPVDLSLCYDCLLCTQVPIPVTPLATLWLGSLSIQLLAAFISVQMSGRGGDDTYKWPLNLATT